MLKMVCDKCGKAVLAASIESISIRNRITILDRRYDLCRECKLKVMMFIDGKMPYEECEDCETHLKAQTEREGE